MHRYVRLHSCIHYQKGVGKHRTKQINAQLVYKVQRVPEVCLMV